MYCALVIHNVLNCGDAQCTVLMSKLGSSSVLYDHASLCFMKICVTPDASACCFVLVGTGLQAVLVTISRNLYGSSLVWHVWIETSEGVCVCVSRRTGGAYCLGREPQAKDAEQC